MKKNNHLAASALLSTLAGAACGAANTPAPATAAEPSGAKDGCGNHPPGACAAADGAKTATTAPGGAVGALAIARTETVKPGEHVEINLSFAETSAANATFKASGAVAWNVHSHAHGDAVVHQKGEGTSGNIAFSPPAPGTYSLLWTNDGTAPVTLELKVSGGRGVAEQHR